MPSAVLTQTLAAGQTAVFGRGRIFNLLQASSPVSIVCDQQSGGGGNANLRQFNNIPAGSKFVGKPGEEWTYLRLTSVAAQAITLFVGDDDMSFNNAVTVTGVAVVNVSPNAAIASPAAGVVDGNVANASALSIPANLARRAITISSPPTNTGTVYVQQPAAGAGPHGIPLQPGTFVTLTNTAAMDVRNDSGAAQWITTTEES